jgi:hypothetical protein
MWWPHQSLAIVSSPEQLRLAGLSSAVGQQVSACFMYLSHVHDEQLGGPKPHEGIPARVPGTLYYR